MKTSLSLILRGMALTTAISLPGVVFAHGDVAPQPVDTTGLDPVGEEWAASNPYRDNAKAIEIGASAYNQNCARCHGLGAVSGGIAPDLRKLEPGELGDEWFIERVVNGAVRNGITYMPVFASSNGGPLSQEALWTIRAWLETLYDPNL